MLNCLLNYIGLASSVGTAESGLYLDALPGINIFNVTKIADKGQDYEGNKAFDDVEKRTIAKFRSLFITEFNRCHKLYNRDAIDCLICENKELFAVSLWYLMGAEMCEEFLRSDRINRHTTVDRQKIKESQASFLDAFYSEISTAILGIDLNGSSCFENIEQPECKSFVKVVQTCP